MKRQQWITACIGFCLVFLIYVFGRTVTPKKHRSSSADSNPEMVLSIDSILTHAKEQLSPEQIARINALENSISRGDVKNQQLNIYHELAHFWGDSARIFEPYAWYEAEAARLENSEKNLTFAAHLFLNNLRVENNPAIKKWKALQARDLFERSLKINPDRDSSVIGLGASYIFGNISDNPMVGILKVKEIADKDSTNIFAQMILAQGSVISGQYEKAISRLETVNRLQPDNLEAILTLAEVFEKKEDKASAIIWYKKSLPLIIRADFKAEVNGRIEELQK
ncbi:MAG: hypothetical protein M3O67_01280 [Bacteroidota bacterium]|nr:hypothetical protein [Bacteroidota bacterium]